MRRSRGVDQFIAVDPAPKNTGIAIMCRAYPHEIQVFYGEWIEQMFPLLKERVELYGSISRTKIFFEDTVLFGKNRSNAVGIFIKEQRAIVRYIYGEDNVWSPYPQEWKKHFGLKKGKKPTITDLRTLLENRKVKKIHDIPVGNYVGAAQDVIDACFILFHGMDTYYASLQTK